MLPDTLNNSTDIGESALVNPLPSGTIPSVTYTRLNLVAPLLAGLRQRSDARVTTNEDFIYIRQDIDKLVKTQSDKTDTLNEQEAIRERQADNARMKAREAEYAMRPLSAEKIFDITVENSVTNGLPTPEALCETNQNALLIATNSNGTVSIMTTNNSFAVGIPINSSGGVGGVSAVMPMPASGGNNAVGVVLNQHVTNTPTGALHYGTVITKPPRDPWLDETVRILADYVAAMKKDGVIIAGQ